MTGETVHLCIFDGRQTTLIRRSEPTREHTNRIVVVESSPAHCTATGKAALAYQPDSVVARLVSLGLRSYTPKTITAPLLLGQELQEVSKQGYAIDDEEISLGLRCVGAPIRNSSGRVFASLSVSGPTRRMTRVRVASLSRLVIQNAEAISAQLGYRPEQVKHPKRERGANRNGPLSLR